MYKTLQFELHSCQKCLWPSQTAWMSLVQLTLPGWLHPDGMGFTTHLVSMVLTPLSRLVWPWTNRRDHAPDQSSWLSNYLTRSWAGWRGCWESGMTRCMHVERAMDVLIAHVMAGLVTNVVGKVSIILHFTYRDGPEKVQNQGRDKICKKTTLLQNNGGKKDQKTTLHLLHVHQIQGGLLG